MLSHPFMQHALVAGTAVAVVCGLVGYFVVLRAQVFAGDALSHVSYTGAMAALAAGIDLRLGLFAACVGVGVALGGLGLLERRGIADDTVIGVTFAWVLGLGALLQTVFTSSRAAGNSTANTTVLFGSVFGISGATAVTAAVVAAGLVMALLVMARPLLFATLDPEVARARGVPTRVLGPAFLGLVGATAAEAAQVVGALLLLGLIAAPAAAAQRLTVRPWFGLALSSALSVASVWAGLSLAYAASALPASFAVIAVTTATYVGASVVASSRRSG
jgi:zinc/manganese transport system permease protein